MLASRSSIGHAAGTQQHRIRPAQVEHCGFDPDVARPAVQHGVDPAGQPIQHMLRGGRADLPRAVGRGAATGRPTSAQQRQRHGVARHAHRQRIQAGAGQQRHRTIRLARQHQRQRPRPERIGQAPGALIRDDMPEGRRRPTDSDRSAD